MSDFCVIKHFQSKYLSVAAMLTNTVLSNSIQLSFPDMCSRRLFNVHSLSVGYLVSASRDDNHYGVKG